MITEKTFYIQPNFEIVEVELEQGFTASSFEDPGEKPEQEW